MTDIELLMTPPTDLEVAALGAAASEGLTTAGMLILRRLAFDRDRLKTENDRLQREAADAKARMWDTGHDNDRLISEAGKWEEKARMWENSYEVEAETSELRHEELEKIRAAIKDAGFGIMQTSGKWSLHCTTEAAKRAEEVEGDLIARNIELEAENTRLRREAELMLGDWTNVKARDRLAAAVRGQPNPHPEEEASPGTPLAIMNAVFRFAEEECGHSPASARHGFATIRKWVLDAKKRLAILDEVEKRTDGRPVSFLDHLKARAHELADDFPFDGNSDDAFTWLWVISSSLEGTELARLDWVKLCEEFRDALDGLLNRAMGEDYGRAADLLKRLPARNVSETQPQPQPKETL